MQINIATPGVIVSEGLLHLIRSRFSRLERMFTGITGCEITRNTIMIKVNEKQTDYYQYFI